MAVAMVENTKTTAGSEDSRNMDINTDPAQMAIMDALAQGYFMAILYHIFL